MYKRQQGNGVWDLGERTENNNRYDVGEIFFDYGVDGLIVDDCLLLKKILIKKGLW